MSMRTAAQADFWRGKQFSIKGENPRYRKRGRDEELEPTHVAGNYASLKRQRAISAGRNVRVKKQKSQGIHSYVNRGD